MTRQRWILITLASLALLSGSVLAQSAVPEWAGLTAAQKQALAPLERDWASIEAPRRAKWLEVAAKFPAMPAEERSRLQQRMADWARLTPAERSRARLQFQETKQVPATERQAKWEAYKALSDDEKRALAQKAKPAARAASTAPKAAVEVAPGKRNLVQAPGPTPTKAVTPTAQQAKPGATTTAMTSRPQPPAHQQAGLPKIAATPGFVDPSTLLPRRGPQGAAVRAASAASESAAAPP